MRKERSRWNRLRLKPGWDGRRRAIDCHGYCRQGAQLHEREGTNGFPRLWRPGLPKGYCTARGGKAFCLIEDAANHCSLRGTSAMQNHSIMRNVWLVFKREKGLPTGKHKGRLSNLVRDGYYSHLSERRACAIIHGGAHKKQQLQVAMEAVHAQLSHLAEHGIFHNLSVYRLGTKRGKGPIPQVRPPLVGHARPT